MQPIFVGGCDRSGTTLLGHLLGSLDRVVVVPEAPFKCRLVREFDPAGNNESLLGWLENHLKFQAWEDQTGGTLRSLADEAATGRSFLEELVKRHAGNHPAVWVDHTPRNLADARNLLEWFPEAIFIHLIRDGRAVVNSLLGVDWGPATAPDGALYWTQRLSRGFSAFRIDSLRGHEVRYEELVQSPDQVIRDLTEGVDVEASDEIETGETTPVDPYHRVHHERLTTEVDPNRATAWRQELTTRQVELIQWQAGGVLQNLGYDLAGDRSNLPPGRWERFKLWGLRQVRTLRDKLHQRRRRRKLRRQND